MWKEVARASGVGMEDRPGLGEEGTLGTEPAGLDRGGWVSLNPKAKRSGYPSSMGFVGWTGVRTGSGVTISSVSSLYPHFPVLPSWRTTEISFRPAPCLGARPIPRPPASPICFNAPPPPPAPPNPGDGPGRTRDDICPICPEHHGQGLGLAPAPQARPCGRKRCRPMPALPGPRGAYLHTIILFVSSTLPSCEGEKVEGYQHQAGHRGPQGEEQQHGHRRTAGAASAIRGTPPPPPPPPAPPSSLAPRPGGAR